MKKIVTYRQDWIDKQRLVHVEARAVTVDPDAVVTGDYVQLVDPESEERFVVSLEELAVLVDRRP